jgi:putative FmdB family regulatory protein
MPLYEYYCSACTQRFEKLRSSEMARLEAHCPECGSFSRRVVSVFARRAKGISGQDVSLTERLPEMPGGGCGCGGSCACGSSFGRN